MPTIRPGNTPALLIVDVQRDVVATAHDRDRIVGNVALTVARAREAGVPVIWVQHHDEEYVRGSEGWAWVPELDPRETETTIHKQFNSAFEDTLLDEELARLGVSRIILAGAGFCDAGPILHHLTAGVDREDCRVILAGYHPPGSIGDGLRRGAKLVEINGKIIEVQCRVSEVEGLSGHGGRDDLLAWLAGIGQRPTRVLLNHGTEASRLALEHAIQERLGFSCVRPLPGEPHSV